MLINPFLSRLIAGVFFASLCSPVVALDTKEAADKEVKNDYQIRFFCPKRKPLLHYFVDAKGRVDVLDAEFGDNPPHALNLGKDELHVRVSLSEGSLGSWIQLPDKKIPGGVLDLLAEKITFPKSGGADNSSGGGGGAPTVTDMPFVRLRIPSHDPTLVCFYQPSHKGKWIPPKEMIVSLNDETAPAGACITMNLSETPIFAAVGEGAKPFQVKPGTFVMIPSITKDAKGLVPLKLAMGSSVICRKPQRFPSGERTLLVVTPVDPINNAGCPANFQVFDLDMPKPKEKVKAKSNKD